MIETFEAMAGASIWEFIAIVLVLKFLFWLTGPLTEHAFQAFKALLVNLYLSLFPLKKKRGGK